MTFATDEGSWISLDVSPDGTTIVFELWLYHVDGGSGVKLTGNTEEQRNLNPLGAAFGRDGRYVYYTERTQAGSVYNQLTFRLQGGRRPGAGAADSLPAPVA